MLICCRFQQRRLYGINVSFSDLVTRRLDPLAENLISNEHEPQAIEGTIAFR
jgi:hypothetical protein